MEKDDQIKNDTKVSTPVKVGRQKKVLTQQEKDDKNKKRREKYAENKIENKKDEESLKSDLQNWLNSDATEDDAVEYEAKEQTPIQMVVPKTLLPNAANQTGIPIAANEDYIKKSISEVTRADRAKKLQRVKEKSATSVLPKTTAPKFEALSKKRILAAANDGFAVWKSNRPQPIPTPSEKQQPVQNKVDIQTSNPTTIENNTTNNQTIQTQEQSKLLFDKNAERWRDEDGKFAVSPTKSANKILDKVSTTGLLEGTLTQRIAKTVMEKKESNARKASLEEQEKKKAGSDANDLPTVEKVTPSPTSTNKLNIQNAKNNTSVNGESAEEKLDQNEQVEKIIDILKNIEENTNKDGKKRKENEDEKKSGGLIGLIKSGLVALASKFTNLFKPMVSVFNLLVGAGKKLLSGLGDLVKYVGGIVGKGLGKVADLAKDGFNKVAEKLGKKPLTTVATKTAETATKASTTIATKTALKTAGTAAAKIASKAVPLLGAAAAGAYAVQAYKKGDMVGAGLEAASGLASFVPFVGTAASIGISAYQAKREMEQAEKVQAATDKMLTTGVITKDEEAMLKKAEVEISENVKIISTETSKTEVAKKVSVAKTEPVPTSKIADKMKSVEQSSLDNKAVEVENKVNQVKAGNIINNTTNQSGGKSSNATSTGRIYARNSESTLDKWLASRYAWI